MIAISRAFTLIELLVVIAIIAILAAILFPVFAQAKGAAFKAACGSNVRQVVMASLMYANDNDDSGPGAANSQSGSGMLGGWMFYSRFPAADDKTPGAYDPTKGSIYPYVKNAQIFACPTDSYKKSGNSLAINACLTNKAPTVATGRGLTSFEEPSNLLFFCEESDVGADSDTGSTDDGYFLYPVNPLSTRHLLQSNIGFVDGHAKSVRPSQAIARGFPYGSPDLSACP